MLVGIALTASEIKRNVKIKLLRIKWLSLCGNAAPHNQPHAFSAFMTYTILNTIYKCARQMRCARISTGNFVKYANYITSVSILH